MKQETTKSLVFASLLLAMALVLNILFDFMPTEVLRIRLGTPFLRFIPILFGPFYGGISFLLNDVLNHIISPKGAFLFPLTIIEIFKGLSIGYLWKKIKDIPEKAVEVMYLVLWSLPLIFSFVSIVVLQIPSDSGYKSFLVQSNKDVLLYLVLFFLLSLSSFVVYVVAKNKNRKETADTLKIFLSILIVFIIPAFIGTTINTFVLNKVYGFGGSKSFMIFYFPRIIKEFIQTIFSAYIVTFFYNLYKKIQGHAD